MLLSGGIPSLLFILADVAENWSRDYELRAPYYSSRYPLESYGTGLVVLSGGSLLTARVCP